MHNLLVVHGKKCNSDYNNRHCYHLDDADDDNIDCNMYNPNALKTLPKNYKDTEIYALLDTIQVKYCHILHGNRKRKEPLQKVRIRNNSEFKQGRRQRQKQSQKTII